MLTKRQIWPRPSIAIEGNQIWHGGTPRPLRLCGSTIRPTFSSFYVFSFVTCEEFVRFEQLVPYTWKKVGFIFEGFKVHNANCENNSLLNFKVKPLGGLRY